MGALRDGINWPKPGMACLGFCGGGSQAENLVLKRFCFILYSCGPAALNLQDLDVP